MKWKYLFCLFCMLVVNDARAIRTVSGLYSSWKDGSLFESGNQYNTGNFVISGSVGDKGQHGTYGDEYGVVAVIARQIVEHGGYFCPQQIQCSNTNCRHQSNTVYYDPTGFDGSKCAWFCEKGYTGTNCTKVAIVTEGSSTPTNLNGLFAGLSMKTSGGGNGGTEASNVAFRTWYEDRDGPNDNDSDYEHDVLLGVIDFKEHGIVAGPIEVKCRTNRACSNWSYVDYIKSFSSGKYKLLCAEGYVADQTGAECVKLTQNMLDLLAYEDKPMCNGWPIDSYDPDIHRLDGEGSCIRYFCKDASKAFPASGNFDCEDCATSIRGGQDPKNGQCVVCDRVGQYFNTDTGACANADAYKKSDLQYGKGKTKDSDADVDNQCWTKVTIEEYAPCVKGESVSTTDASSSTSSSSSGISGSKVIAPQDMLDTTLRK